MNNLRGDIYYNEENKEIIIYLNSKLDDNNIYPFKWARRNHFIEKEKWALVLKLPTTQRILDMALDTFLDHTLFANIHVDEFAKLSDSEWFLGMGFTDEKYTMYEVFKEETYNKLKF